MAVDAHANFGYGIVTAAPSPRDTGTSLSISAADAANFAAVPFNAVAWPPGLPFPLASVSEIVRVTANASGAFTITRAQESTTAKAIDVGWNIANATTVKVFTDIEAALNPTGTINPYAGRTAPTNWLLCDGSNVSRTTYAALFAVIAPTLAGNPTITNATPAVVTLSAHGLVTGDAIYLTTTGGLPTGLSANTIYYVVKIDANSFNLSTTLANAIAGTKIATSSAGSGVHTAVACPYGLGDGSTTFGLPDLRGRVPAGADAMGGTAASRITLADATNGVYGTAGASGGEQRHTLVTAELASHSHSVGGGQDQFVHGGAGADASASITQTGAAFKVTPPGTGTDTAGSGTPHNNIQPTLVVNYIVKT